MLRPLALTVLLTFSPRLPAQPGEQPERIPSIPLADAEAARRDALTRYGVGLLRAGNDLPVQAIKQFEAAAKTDPAAAAPLKELVKLYADLGRDPAAIRAARKVLDLDPADAGTAHALGKLLYDGKKYADAAAALKQAADSPRVAGDPVRRFGILRDLARACEAGRDWPGATASLRAALAVVASGRDVLLKSPVYSSAADLDRATADVRERLGRSLVEEKRFADAAAEFRTAAQQFAAAGDGQAAARLGWNLSGALAAEGKVDDALAELTPLLALRPGNLAPYERLAELLRRQHRSRDVPPALKRLVAADPKNDAVRWVLAGELLQDGDPTADGMFRDLAGQTTDPRFFRYLVHAYAVAGRAEPLLVLVDQLYRAARPEVPKGGKRDTSPAADPAATARAQAVTAAVKAEPDFAPVLLRWVSANFGPYGEDTWELVGMLAEREGRFDLVEHAARRSAAQGNSAATFRLLDVLTKLRKWSEVQAVAVRASQAAARANLVSVYEASLAAAHAEQGNGSQALDAIDTFARNLQTANARRQKPYILNILGRHQEAAAECLRLLAQDTQPADVRAVRPILSDAYLGLKEYAKAEAELRAMLDDDPDDVLALNNLGYNLADQGRNLAEAEELIRRAIALDRDEAVKAGNPEPYRGTYLDSLGWVLFRRGKLAEARDVLERTVTTWDAVADPTVWDHLGDVRFRQGDKAGARTAWGKAAELYVGSHQGRQNGRLDEVKRKLSQAE